MCRRAACIKGGKEVSGMPDVQVGGMHKVGKEMSGMPRVMDHMSKNQWNCRNFTRREGLFMPERYRIITQDTKRRFFPGKAFLNLTEK